MRPTPERVRETLFNWLGARVAGAHCLDLFAGTGALGLEAASRGAADVWFNEHDGTAARALETLIARFAEAADRDVRSLAAGLHVTRLDALVALAGHARQSRRFDIVFLDPPFAQAWFDRVMTPVSELLAPGGRIYFESAAELTEPAAAALGWTRLRHDRAGHVHYHLLTSTEDSSPCRAPSTQAHSIR